MGLFGRKPAATGKQAAKKGSVRKPNRASEGGKGWGASTTVGGAFGNGWEPAEASAHGHDSAGSADRSSWSYGNASTGAAAGGAPNGSEYGVHGAEAWNGGGAWENDGWNGRRERTNEW